MVKVNDNQRSSTFTNERKCGKRISTNGFIETKHCEGKYNLSDMFTKEDKDIQHYITSRDHIMSDHIPEFEYEKNIIVAKRAISVSYASTSLLYVSEGGCQYGCTDRHCRIAL